VKQTFPPSWICGSRSITLDRPSIMAIINVTPDSFSDGGLVTSADEAVRAAARMVGEGADAIDVGGESTRPGATRVPVEEQIRRVVPSIAAIRRVLGDDRSTREGRIVISVDTTRAEVARAALDAGADAINDVSAGREDAAMFALAARHRAGLVLMHRLVTPEKDSYSDRYERGSEPRYGDVVGEVRGFARERAAAALASGVYRESIVLDPGLGFGKTVEQNLRLVEAGGSVGGEYPVLSALSRKSFVARAGGAINQASAEPLPPSERVHATVGLSVLHMVRGARVFRVHDVRVHREALDAAWAGMSAAPATD
jgi:dihydropteroate synthase